jgi:hypothetical protein
MPEYVDWKGVRVTPYMAYQLTRLDNDFYKKFGLRIGATSGIRLRLEQEDIFKRRYVTAGNINGRKVYDTRWWQGKLWYRISSAGTVAVPGTSNHEIQGTNAAVDIYDTGSDAGITVKNSVRGRWLRENEWKYDMEPEGDGFKEGWHHKMKNIFKAVPKPSGGSSTPDKPTKGVKVTHYFRDDGKARRTKLVNKVVTPVGVDLAPGEGYWLHTSETAGNSQATNIVGGIGEYEFTTHLYADGKPGDVLIVQLYWDNTKTSGPHSAHFQQDISINDFGQIRDNTPFARAVTAGFAVYARVMAHPKNKGSVKVTRFATDALLFVKA